jgi:hypothetical protein
VADAQFVRRNRRRRSNLPGHGGQFQSRTRSMSIPGWHPLLPRFVSIRRLLHDGRIRLRFSLQVEEQTLVHKHSSLTPLIGRGCLVCPGTRAACMTRASRWTTFHRGAAWASIPTAITKTARATHATPRASPTTAPSATTGPPLTRRATRLLPTCPANP